jgi:SAM-dependent methyltransferase
VQDEVTVTAADIARLAGVGRTAVSNWRRRYPDFPRPTGGTPASPLFGLAEIEAWLRGQGKLLEIPLAERAWQELRSLAVDDLQLDTALASAGELMADGDPGLPSAISELSAAFGPGPAFEALLSRVHEMHSRRTAAEVAEMMAAFAGGATTVLDPACGTGDLLLAVHQRDGTARLLGQDLDGGIAHLAAVRLGLAGASVSVRAGDSLHSDAFPGALADVVLCDPPFHERAWGHEDLSADSRWVYGLPPRMEPELAWVQHALSHLAPGGRAAVLMPAAAAARRPGRRIRAQLLRKGALRAVVECSAGLHLWLLGVPSGEVPGAVLMASFTDPDAVMSAWQGRQQDGLSRLVPVIDLLDDEVDLAPARYLSGRSSGDVAVLFQLARDRLAAVTGELAGLIPDLRPGPVAGLEAVPLAELAWTGQLTILHAAARRVPGDHPVILAEDIGLGRGATGLGQADEHAIQVRAGDVLAAAAAGRIAVVVAAADGDLLGPGVTLLRVDQRTLDPYFIAATLRGASLTAVSTGSGSGRADVRRVRVPRLPLDEQRRLGAAYEQAARLEAAARIATAASAELAQLLSEGVAGGTFRSPL